MPSEALPLLRDSRMRTLLIRTFMPGHRRDIVCIPDRDSVSGAVVPDRNINTTDTILSVMQLSKSQMIILAVVAVAVVAVAGIAVVMNSNNDSDPVTEGVIYHGNGGQTEDGKTVYGITEKTVQAPWFSYNGHAFTSWNTKADGSGTSYRVGDTISYNPKVSLYAQWGLSGTFKIPMVPGISCHLVDSQGKSVPMGSTVAMPADGVASIVITGGHNWTYDSGHKWFIGYTADGKHKYTASIDITSDVSNKTTKLVNGMPTCTFSFDKAVTGEIFVIYSSS